MTLGRFDHVAIEVADFDAEVEQLAATGALKVLRYGTMRQTGLRIAMLGDGTGAKIELIENPDAVEPRFAHLAFRSRDIRATREALESRDWRILREPQMLADARAESMLAQNARGLSLQAIRYDETSPDIVEWDQDSEEAGSPRGDE